MATTTIFFRFHEFVAINKIFVTTKPWKFNNQQKTASTTTLFWGGKFSGKLATTTKSTKIRSQIANNSPTSQLVVVFC
jgi:hypothetical protein